MTRSLRLPRRSARGRNMPPMICISKNQLSWSDSDASTRAARMPLAHAPLLGRTPRVGESRTPDASGNCARTSACCPSNSQLSVNLGTTRVIVLRLQRGGRQRMRSSHKAPSVVDIHELAHILGDLALGRQFSLRPGNMRRIGDYVVRVQGARTRTVTGAGWSSVSRRIFGASGRRRGLRMRRPVNSLAPVPLVADDGGYG